MKKEHIIIGILSLIIIVGVCYFSYNYTYNSGFEDGYNQGFTQGQNFILTDICQDGAVSFNNNGTLVKIPLTEMCR